MRELENGNIEVCAECNGDLKGLQCSEDGDYIDQCEGCGETEGKTKELTEKEYEALHEL